MSTAQAWSEEYLVMVVDCEKREKRLSEWEREFIASLRSRLEAGRMPTARQVETLNETWERATARG